MVEVVAALIWDHDRSLICQRPTNKARPLLWEYVGGKVEPGETKEAALVRECKEELNITVSVHSVFFDVVHEYPDITIHLTIFNASISDGEITLLEHNDFRWILPSEIPNFEFCPADESLNILPAKPMAKPAKSKSTRDSYGQQCKAPPTISGENPI